MPYDYEKLFMINKRGKLLFSKKRNSFFNQRGLAVLENKIILITSRYFGVPEGERILLEVYDFDLKPVGLYTIDFPNYLYFNNIQIVKLNLTDQLIFSVGNNPLAFLKVDFSKLKAKSLYVNSYQAEQINGMHQINDSTILGYGGTMSLGKASSGYLSGPHLDFLVFKIDTSFNKKEFFSLGVLDNFWGDETSSQFLAPVQNGFFASYISNNWNSNPKLNVNEYDFDSLYSCDAIYNGDTIFNASVFNLPILMDTLKKMTEISENINDLPFLLFDTLTLAEDTLCINDCDFNVLITANYYDDWEDNGTYIKVEVKGKNNPYKISWNDGDTTWIRENQFKSHSSFDVSDSAGCKRSFEYYFDRTIGVKEVTEKIEFTLYPNPTHGILNFSTSTIQKVNSLQIFDLFGRMVYELKNVELFEGYSIDLSHLQNGVYFVVSQTENNQFTNRIIISK